VGVGSVINGFTPVKSEIFMILSGDTVVSRVSSIYIKYMSTETLSCIFTQAGEMQAPEIFGS